MAGTIIADNVNAASTSTLILKNGVASAAPQFQDASGVQIGTLCRAWVNFNGTGTIAIRSSFNISSITDNGVGNYTINLTTAIYDAEYSTSLGYSRLNASTDPTQVGFIGCGAKTTSSLRVFTDGTTGTAIDFEAISVSIFR